MLDIETKTINKELDELRGFIKQAVAWKPGSLRTCMATIGVTSEGHVFPIRCKSWACETCKAINAMHAAVQCANGIDALFLSGIRPKFVTLTLRGGISPDRAYKVLPDMWDKMRRRFTLFGREFGLPFMYCAFIENQSRGVPHLHIVSSISPKHHELKEWSVKSGMGYMVDVQPIAANKGVAWYISKYVGKGNDKGLMPKGFRRVRYSENWPRVVLNVDRDEERQDVLVKRPNEPIFAFVERVALEFDIDCRSAIEQLLISAQ